MIDHLKKLGVTTIELLPIHGLIDDRVLIERKLANYWGYNTLAFFAPEPRYAQDNALDAFRTTVARLHDAGIEVQHLWSGHAQGAARRVGGSGWV